MKKRAVALLVLLSLLITIPAYAVTPRTVDIGASIAFNRTEVVCTAKITGERQSDTISATMTLMKGSQIVAFWRGNGTWSLDMNGTAPVETGVTYTLTVDALINGVWQTPFTTSRTHN